MSENVVSHERSGRGARAVLALLVGALALTMLPGVAEAAKGKGKKKGEKVTVMTRNLYLGADLGPGLSAPDLNSFVDAAGTIVNQVDANNFPARAKSLAAEILNKKPHLVGLQEVALWRTAANNPGSAGSPGTATTVEYDWLDSLLDELNKNKKLYRAVVIQEEFDFEAPVNDVGPPGGLLEADRNARLTMRDVILARKGVKTSKPRSGTFANLLNVTAAGLLPINVTRGWTSVDAKVGSSKRFHFVNTHFEAFDDETQVPSIRRKQADELVGPGGPAQSKLPVILLGDLNSNDPGVQPGDAQAFQAVAAAGFRNRDASSPLSCCLNSSLITAGGGGSVADFDHKVDHILTDTKAIKRLKSSVVGLQPVNGFWPSDHAGLVSTLSVPAKGK
ncbi:MAG: hypothetical protein FJW90_09105 [Actinobacteria bacterium]|nr:hypothetical protein [Actinomycetota bacterium]